MCLVEGRGHLIDSFEIQKQYLLKYFMIREYEILFIVSFSRTVCIFVYIHAGFHGDERDTMEILDPSNE